MNAETLRALKGSIRKWERIVEGKEEDRGVANCPLCELFANNDCLGCPVLKKIGRLSCGGTPYVDWFLHCDAFHELPAKVICPTCKELAQKELDFLRSLLPEKKKERKR